VSAAREELRMMVEANPIAEAALDRYSDWDAIEAMERL
jgi:hypothetical protein